MFTKPTRASVTAITISITLLGLGCNKEPSTPDEWLQHSFATGDWNTTVALCNQMLERNPDDVEIILLRGRAHLGAGDLEDAVRDFTRLIELKPEDPEGFYHREIAYRKLGQMDLAERDGQTARSFDMLYKSAYAYDPSNFHPEVDLSSFSSPPQTENNSDQESQPFDETIFSDETGFEPDETSRVLASGTPGREDGQVSESAGDIGIPKAPQIVHESLIPKLDNPNDDKTGEKNDELAFKNLQFPANPTVDEADKSEIPDIGEPAKDQATIPELTTSLPSDPSGSIVVPGAAPGTLSTGLPPSRPTIAAPAQGAPLGRAAPVPTGLNAPATIATGLNAPDSVSPRANFGPSEVRPIGLNSSDPVFVPKVGFSGLPLPKGATGLPTARTGQQFVLPGSDATNYAPTSLPRAQPYRGNPIFAPSDKPVITTSLPGYPAPNSVAPTNPTPAQPITISTSLSETVLQNRLSRPTQSGTPAVSQFRSLQQQ